MIRPAERRDRAAIVRLLDSAFAPSTFESRLYELVAEGVDQSFEWVAESESEIVGYIMYTEATTGTEAVGLHLAPVAVHADFQGQGIGSALIRTTLEEEPLRTRAIFVLGEPRYYERFGFTPVSSARCPYDEGNAHFRALRWSEIPDEFPIGYIDAFTQAEEEITADPQDI